MNILIKEPPLRGLFRAEDASSMLLPLAAENLQFFFSSGSGSATSITMAHAPSVFFQTRR